MDRVVDYLVYEQAQVRADRKDRRSFIIIIILIIALVGTNVGWVYYDNQFTDIQTTSIEAEQDGSEVNIVSGGSVNYGAESKDNNN